MAPRRRTHNPLDRKRKRTKKQGTPPKPSPIRSTTEHFRPSLSQAEIEVAGVWFGLVESDELDPWEVFAEPRQDWPLTLIDHDERDHFLEVWEAERFPLDMVDDIVAGALGLIIGNNWGMCRAVVAFAMETDIAPRIAVNLARGRIDPWSLPSHLLPLVLYGLLTEWAPQAAKSRLDKAIREFGDTITVRAERDDMQLKLDEFDSFLEELGLDLTTGPDEEE